MRTKEDILQEMENLQKQLQEIEFANKQKTELEFFNDPKLQNKINTLKIVIKKYELPFSVETNEDERQIKIIKNHETLNPLSLSNQEYNMYVDNQMSLNTINTLLDCEINYCHIYHHLRDLFKIKDLLTIQPVSYLENPNQFEFNYSLYNFKLTLNDNLTVQSLVGTFDDLDNEVSISFKKYGFDLDIIAYESYDDTFCSSPKFKLAFKVKRENFTLNVLRTKIVEICEILDGIPDYV